VALADSVRLARSARIIDRANQDFSAARLRFFQAHGRQEGATWVLDPADTPVVERHNSEMAELLGMEIELPIPSPIALTPECKLTALEILPLLDLVEG
jgi:hypothetical protein